uniref:Glyco_hydro_65m domain-containing protein n=1 Tax=Mesocestoides corti TaxID=53468 RepID=A0A5K3EU29_MESCO
MMHIPDSWLEYGFEFSNLLGPTENFIIEQCTRSDNDILLPNLCNGYIGMDLTTPWLFLDGIYSGTGSDSHRASIPSPVCWLPEVEGMTCLRRYTLFHFGMGVCLDVQTFNGFDLYTSTFVSRARPHLIVRCVEAVFLESHTTSVVFKPNRKVDWETPDFATTVKEANARSYFTGQVYQMEDAHLLPHMDSVYMISQVVSDFNVNGILLTRSRPSVTFLTTLSRCGHSDALEAFESGRLTFRYTHEFAALSVQLSSPVGLLTENAEAWLRTWSAGRIVLTTDSPATHGRNENWEVLVNKSGDSDSVTSCELPQSTGEGVRSAFSLSRCLIAAQYALLASFPDVIPDYLMIPQGEGSAQPLKCGFFGLSPSGLGRGSNEQDYQGHVFWDMDIWMLPWVSLLHPNFSELAFDYRHATLRNAELRAKREGL